MFHHLISLLASLYCVAKCQSDLIDPECDLLQKPHKFVSGTGIFAGRNFRKGEVLEKSLSVAVASTKSSFNILDRYVFDSDIPGMAAFMMGCAMNYNHLPEHLANIEIIENGPHVRSKRSLKSDQVVRDYFTVAKRDIAKGEEITSTYGDDLWFTQRGEKYANPAPLQSCIDSVSMSVGIMDGQSTFQQQQHSCPLGEPNNTADSSEGQEFPGCATKFTQVVGDRVYSTQMFLEGDVIEVVRALKLPDSITAVDPLYGYAWFEEKGSVGMVLLGNGMLYSATPEGLAGEMVQNSYNVRYKWFNYSSSPNEETQLTWLNLIANEMAFVAIVAARDIDVNEELTVPLMVSNTTGQRRVFNALLPREKTIAENVN